MSPFSTALHQLSRFWGSLARYSRKVKTVTVTVSDTPSSPGPLPSPQKILEEPQYAADFFYADDLAHSFPSSFSFSDPSSSFGLPWLPFTSPRHDLTPVPVGIEENPSTVSYEEILVTGQNRIAAYEEWCRVTNNGKILETHDQEQIERGYCCVCNVDGILSLQASVIEILLGQGIYKLQAESSQHVTVSGSLTTELQILKKYREKLISHRLLLQTVRQVASRITEHPKSQNINFSHLRLHLTSTPRFEEMGTEESYSLFHRIQLFLQENNIPRLKEAAKLFVDSDDPDAVINGRLLLH